MDRIELIIVRGKLDALEQGLITGLMTVEYIRSEALDLLKKKGIPEEEKRRLEALSHATDVNTNLL